MRRGFVLDFLADCITLKPMVRDLNSRNRCLFHSVGAQRVRNSGDLLLQPRAPGSAPDFQNFGLMLHRWELGPSYPIPSELVGLFQQLASPQGRPNIKTENGVVEATRCLILASRSGGARRLA
jgi:hypothetical protein